MLPSLLFSWFPRHCFPHLPSTVDLLLFPPFKAHFPPFSPPLCSSPLSPLLVNCCSAPIPPSYNLVFFGSLISCSNKHTGPGYHQENSSVWLLQSQVHRPHIGTPLCVVIVCIMLVCVCVCKMLRDVCCLLYISPRTLAHWFNLFVCQQDYWKTSF